MEEITLWFMDKYPEYFHKLQLHTIQFMLDEGFDSVQIKRLLSEMVDEIRADCHKF